jgi:hypothetical protein
MAVERYSQCERFVDLDVEEIIYMTHQVELGKFKEEPCCGNCWEKIEEGQK